ncbi:TolC family protein [Burkholderia territorii]|uniref:TolC family protein n=1 Tax=Burkholderia territorii TaxID=1503055 RepID=UPI0018C75DA4|nr:TolC family protein [Burkholderia territorii]
MILMKRCASFVLLAAISASSTAQAAFLDVFRTRADIPPTPTSPLIGTAICPDVRVDVPLEFEDVILRAICSHPRARQTWSVIRARAAAVGSARTAYLPSLNASTDIQRDTVSARYDYSVYGLGSVDNSQTTSSMQSSLDLGWLLFDFDQRGASIQQAHALLAAANANHDEALQTIFFDAAHAFYAVRDAQAAARAANLNEEVAHRSLVIAQAKHQSGVGALIDQLQARTAYRRAVLDRISAEGSLHVAAGVLSVAMGLDANVPVRIASAKAMPSEHVIQAGVDLLIDEAKARRPKLIAARAMLDAARADIDAARAQGRPTISLVAKRIVNTPLHGQRSEYASVSRLSSSVVGLQLTIPLFEKLYSGQRVAYALARADEREADLRNTELLVSSEVWRSYHELQADSANLTNARELVDDASRSLEIARGRYKEGVGTFTELLNAQTAFFDAEKQRVIAVSKWRISRLRLAAGLGNLRLWPSD